MDDGKYGAFGWCFTDAGGSSWGSCGRGCPMFGPDAILQDGIESLGRELGEIFQRTQAQEIATKDLSEMLRDLASQTEAAANQTAEPAPAAESAEPAPATESTPGPTPVP